MIFTQLAADSFQRANENPLSDGGNWSVLGGPFNANLEILNDECVSDSASEAGFAFYTGISWPNDQYAEIKIASYGGNSDFGIRLRSTGQPSSPGFTSGGYGFIVSVNNGLVVFKDPNVAPYLQAPGTFPVTVTVGDVFRAAVVGSTLFFLKNGTLLASWSDSTIASGLLGIQVFGGGSITGCAVVNFAGGSVRYCTVSGNAGLAGATVSYSGPTSGSTTADGSGNYSLSLPDGTYTITPTSPPGRTFAPTSQVVTVGSADITGVNFAFYPSVRFTFRERQTQGSATVPTYDVIDSSSKCVGQVFFDPIIVTQWSFNLSENQPFIAADGSDAASIQNFASALPTPNVPIVQPAGTPSTRFSFRPVQRRAGQPILQYQVIDGLSPASPNYKNFSLPGYVPASPTASGSVVGEVIWDGTAGLNGRWTFLQTAASLQISSPADVACITTFAASLPLISPNEIQL
ncbi:MAG: hypothetical protein ABSE45_07325 [Candidatus Acidiferrales bacterium]|jgi:hypothetical protein